MMKRAKVARVEELLPKVFAWARSVHPVQPLTSGVWKGNWSDAAKESTTTKIQLAESDVITFHNYGWPEEFEARILELKPLGRPIICTEYMARGNGSTFDGSLPVAKKYNVGAINWGLVAGKTQTYLPWDSWQRPYVLTQPTIWFHEVFRAGRYALPPARGGPDPGTYRTRCQDGKRKQRGSVSNAMMDGRFSQGIEFVGQEASPHVTLI